MARSRNDVSAGRGGRRPVLDSYARLSKVPETGELEKIETQQADNRAVVERVGGVLGEELSDGLSAWKRNVRRPDWEKLLERVESGASDGVVVWHTDRLFRQPRDLERLIELADKGYRVYSAHGERDLSNPDDRYILRIEVAHAARSSDDTSRRLVRRFEQMRTDGRGHIGGTPGFGWPRRDLTYKLAEGETDEDRPMVSAEQVARERQAIRDAVDALLAGVKQARIIREWNAAGLLSVRGRTWIPAEFRRTMLRPINAGLIEHEGKLIARLADGEPIVDKDKFERMRAMFAARRKGRPQGEGFVATGILKCGVCGRGLAGTRFRYKGKPVFYPGTDEQKCRYFCKKENRGCGSVVIDQRGTDRELRALTIARLSDPRHAAAVAAARARVADRLTAVEAEIEQCRTLQKALSDRVGRREMELDAFDAANKPLAADLARLLAERDTLAGDRDLTGPAQQAQTAAAIAAQWDAASKPDRRALLTQALGSATVYVDRSTITGKSRFDPNRIRLEP